MKEDIIKLKHKVEAEGFAPPNIWPEIVRLCELVAEQEREACAQEAEAHASIEGIGQRIAAAIRARGNT